jgi:hypothetical protein
MFAAILQKFKLYTDGVSGGKYSGHTYGLMFSEAYGVCSDDMRSERGSVHTILMPSLLTSVTYSRWQHLSCQHYCPAVSQTAGETTRRGSEDLIIVKQGERNIQESSKFVK